MPDQLSLSLFEASPRSISPEIPLKSQEPASPPKVESVSPPKEEPKPQETAPEPVVLSISDLNRMIKEQLEGEFGLIWLRGEISNFKGHSSGHFYFSLKDKKAMVRAVMFKGYNKGLRFRPEDGMEVIVRGRISVYEPRGDYQIMCEVMEPVGAGALQMAFDQLKAKLQKEGLFDASRKRAIPKLPSHVAIVTSPTGAAIRDMLNVLGRRFRGLRVTLIPTIVQGDQAPPKIVAALQMANQLTDVDVIIVGRGGGSIEDLWAFNDERVARAIAHSKLPTISAVGHEVDFTIADFVADLRAPTPSAAAELVVHNAADLCQQIGRTQRTLTSLMIRRVQHEKRHLEAVSRRLIDPKRKLQDLALRCDDLTSRLEQSVARNLKNRVSQVELLVHKLGTPKDRIQSLRERLKLTRFHLMSNQKRLLEGRKRDFSQLLAVLDSLSPLSVVARGYSLVTGADGEIIKDSAQLKEKDLVQLQFARGSARARIESLDVLNQGESSWNLKPN